MQLYDHALVRSVVMLATFMRVFRLGPGLLQDMAGLRIVGLPYIEVDIAALPLLGITVTGGDSLSFQQDGLDMGRLQPGDYLLQDMV